MNAPRVLIVEDNPVLREMISRRLLRRGYGVVLAKDGEEGLALALAEPPAIILLDMSLPGMDGWAVAGRLKAAAETCEVPVIALTAHAMRGDRERTLAAGCDDYLSKPINFAELTAKMARLLGDGGSRPGADLSLA